MRQHCFGAAVTAATTEAALDAGAAHVVLYTDLSNPTSNGIYQVIGYRPDHDAEERVFVSADVRPVAENVASAWPGSDSIERSHTSRSLRVHCCHGVVVVVVVVVGARRRWQLRRPLTGKFWHNLHLPYLLPEHGRPPVGHALVLGAHGHPPEPFDRRRPCAP